MSDELTPSLRIPCLLSNIPTVSPDGKVLAAAAWIDKSINIYDARTGKQVARLDDYEVPCSIGFSPDGSTLAPCGWFSSTRVWDAKTWKVKADFGHPAQDVCYAPDGKSIAVAHKKSITVYDLASGKPKTTFQDKRRLDMVRFTPDGKMLATGPGKETKFWNAKSGASAGSVVHKGDIMDMCFSPDGKTLATGGGGHGATLWNMKSLAPLVLKHEELVCGIEFSPDGKRVVTGSFDGCVRVWEAGTGKLVTELAPGADYIFHVTFSPSGKHLIALNDGGQAILWETKNWQRLGSVSKPANSTNPMQPANYEPACPAWFPNGKRFAVGGGNELTVYDV